MDACGTPSSNGRGRPAHAAGDGAVSPSSYPGTLSVGLVTDPRGIPADEARRLLIKGFADQTVDSVSIHSVRAWILNRLGHDDD